MPDFTTDDVATAAAQPMKAEADGQMASAHPLPDQLTVAGVKGTAAATTGLNRNGGIRSPWNGGILRAAQAQTEGA